MIINRSNPYRATLVTILALCLLLPVASYGWGSPEKSFYRSIERALKKERWNHPEEAREYWQEALAYGDELIAAKPNKVLYLMGAGRASYGLGMYEKAVDLYTQAIRIEGAKGGGNPAKKYPWAYIYLGLAHARLGNSDLVYTYWKEVPKSVGPVYRTIQQQLKAIRLSR